MLQHEKVQTRAMRSGSSTEVARAAKRIRPAFVRATEELREAVRKKANEVPDGASPEDAARVRREFLKIVGGEFMPGITLTAQASEAGDGTFFIAWDILGVRDSVEIPTAPDIADSKDMRHALRDFAEHGPETAVAEACAIWLSLESHGAKEDELVDAKRAMAASDVMEG